MTALRATRKRPASGELVSLSAADPLNLTGILVPGARVPSLARNRVLFRDGVPVATHTAGHTDVLIALQPADEWAARQALLRKRGQFYFGESLARN